MVRGLPKTFRSIQKKSFRQQLGIANGFVVFAGSGLVTDHQVAIMGQAIYLPEGLGECLSLVGTAQHEQFTPLLQPR